MVATAESVQEPGFSASMSETAAAHVEPVGAVRREKSARPDDGSENAHNYRKRTKAGMGMVCPTTGWKLEALHGLDRAASPVAPPVGVPVMVGSLAVRPLAELLPVGATAGMGTPMVGGNLSFSTSDPEDYSDDEGADDMGERGKGTSEGGAVAGAGSGEMIGFFEGLTKQAMERQEAMQQRFVEAFEKRERDRVIREEAWRRQGMARLEREQQILAQERAIDATRGVAVLSFLRKITAQTIPLPSVAAPGITFIPPSSQPHATPVAYAAPPPPSWKPPGRTWPQPSPRPPKMAPATPQPQQEALVLHQIPSLTTPAETPRDGPGGGARGRASSSSPRWTKTEVHALIQLRSNLPEAGTKVPLWEEIAAGMDYTRSSKSCRQKWENMNKYFNKVKQSNKDKRPKTCPDYFHHLDALYRIKAAALGSPSGARQCSSPGPHQAFTVAAPISHRAPPPHTLPPVAKNGVTKYNGNGHGVSGGINFEQPPTGTTAGDAEESSMASSRTC